MSSNSDDQDEFEVDLEEEVDVDIATREALDAVSRVEGQEHSDSGDAEAPERSDALVETLQNDLAAMREQALRTLADFENFRRRTERERDEAKKYLIASTFRDLLPIVDNLGRALSSAGSVEDLKTGVGLIHRQLLDLLRQAGVRPIEAIGKPFDPAVHEAVARFEDPSVPTATVADELQPGFMIGERLLRPAMVRVAMPPPRQMSTVAAQAAADEGHSDDEEDGTDAAS